MVLIKKTEREWEGKSLSDPTPSPVFLYQRPLLRSSPLTENLEKARDVAFFQSATKHMNKTLLRVKDCWKIKQCFAMASFVWEPPKILLSFKTTCGSLSPYD